MCIFTAWGLLLLLFKCLGPVHVGVFSGYPYQRDGFGAKAGRSIFGFSALIVIVFSILLTAKGLTKLQDTTDTIDATNQDVIKIHDEFVAISSNLKTISRQATPVRDQLVEFLSGDVCPLVPGENGSLRQVAKGALDALTELSNFIADELELVNKGLRQLAKANNQVDEAVEQVEFTTGAAVGIMIPYYIVPALLMVTLILGWTETYVEGYYCFTTWFTMPFFIIMVIFCYVGCAWVVLATEGNADFCSGGVENTPDATVQNILGQYDLTAGSVYYDAVMFYSHQCKIDGPWGFLENYYDDLTTARTTLNGMAQAIVDVTPENMSQQCGVDYSAVLQLITELQAHTTILSDTAQRSLELLSCRNVVPLYTNAAYVAMCQQNITAATWIFSCSFIMSFFGMIMIMFRGAYYPFFVWEEKDEYSTDDLELEEEVSEEGVDDMDEYVDPSEVDPNLYAEDQEEMETVDESAVNESTTYDNSTYEESQQHHETDRRRRRK